MNKPIINILLNVKFVVLILVYEVLTSKLNEWAGLKETVVKIDNINKVQS